MNLRTTMTAGRSSAGTSGGAHRSHRSLVALRRPAVFLAVAASGALLVNGLSTGEPAAQAASTGSPATSVARELGLTASISSPSSADLRPLQNLTASRSQRPETQGAAGLAQVTTEQDTLRALAAAGQARQDAIAQAQAQAQAAAAAKAAADAAAAQAAQQAKAVASATTASSGSSGSFRDYALSKVGSGQFSCLESLWGRESGWNPNAHNPSSSAYGIPQFLDSTWASTGIGKTSDGYRQIDAGLIYIDSRYGSPCGAWSHSQSTGWY